ncbi:hypothetical protein [Mucilaginibacter lacusdianchii]|uniref:hypothetical protein n=1 Tax=Mucilaginibacter lacusdianchii TaxID=2684211 RepID=UPI00131E02E5|nr:hypothetical protein [Mucilaginibacter sp. JXJ CY 39]
MSNYLTLLYLSLVLLICGCSKKEVPSVPETQNTPVSPTPTFSFTVNVGSITDTSAIITLAITGAKQSDDLKYSVVLNNKTLTENQQEARYIIKDLKSETDYQGIIELKDHSGNVKSQSFNFKTLKYYLKFYKTYKATPNGLGDSFVPTDDGGYVIAGYGPGDQGDYFFYEVITLTKVDKFGKEIWSNKFQYINRFYNFLGHPRYTVAKTSDGGFVVNGSSAIVKVDEAGHKIWDYFFELTGSKLIIESLSVNKDNTIIVCGHNDEGALVCKFTADGKLIWKKSFLYSEGIYTNTKSIIQTNDNGFIVIGEYHADEKEGFGDKVYYAKLDIQGNILWKKSFLQPGTNSAQIIKASLEGNLTILSYTYGYSYHPKLTTISTNGAIITTIDFKPSGDVAVNNFDFTPTGYIVCGQYIPSFATPSNYLTLIKMDKQGGILWQNQYGTELPRDVKYTQEGFVVCGATLNYIGYDLRPEVLLLRLDPEGKL